MILIIIEVIDGHADTDNGHKDKRQLSTVFCLFLTGADDMLE